MWQGAPIFSHQVMEKMHSYGLISYKKASIPCLNNWIAFELIYKSPMNYNFMPVFGCLACATTFLSNQQNFEPRLRATIFIGYHHGIKVCKVNHFVIEEVIISCYLSFIKMFFHYIREVVHRTNWIPSFIHN